jgi:hypothetical protein
MESPHLATALGYYLFVQAGIRDGIRLDELTTDDLLWIRGYFLKGNDRPTYTEVSGRTFRSDYRVTGRPQ